MRLRRNEQFYRSAARARRYLKVIGNRSKGATLLSGSATPGTARRLSIVSVDVFGHQLLFESIIDPWGEDDPILGEIVDLNRYEPRSLNFWAFVVQSADPGSTFLDVGAYTGFYAALTGRLCHAGKVVAIEPAAATFGRLLRNICLNSLDYCIVPAKSCCRQFGRLHDADAPIRHLHFMSR